MRRRSIYLERAYADNGGLMAYGPQPNSFRRAAGYVGQILRGAKPGDLPIREPLKFDFVINLKTAHGVGLSLPPSSLARADEVVE
jgi:putative tryptophan/tyrosine transport system substrate-binding protein